MNTKLNAMKTSNLCLAFLTILFLASCSENETLDESILIHTNETLIKAFESEDYITIRVEALIDSTDNRGGSANASDYCNISIDINSNKAIDSEIDFGYESPTVNYDICSYYFLGNESITHCAGHPTTANFSEIFSSSAESNTPHMIWELKISKEELNFTRNLSFTVKTIDQGVFRTFPPITKNGNPILFNFAETLTFIW